MKTNKEKQQQVFDALKGTYGYTNVFEAPHLSKIVISAGVGSVKDKQKIELIQDRLAKITGQAPAKRGAKKSIASFKVREGDLTGFQVTLRGTRMHEFLNKLLTIAIPRTRDFRGIPSDSFDEMGNYTLGIKEHTIFPETSDEELRNVFGFAVTVVTTAKSIEEARALLTHLGFPFKK
ncbi:MAG: 50S ribosomal protein L5 [Candidatus Paceibacterota bacterium]